MHALALRLNPMTLPDEMEAVGTGLDGLKNNATGFVTTYGIPFMIALIGIGVALGLFRKFGKKAKDAAG